MMAALRLVPRIPFLSVKARANILHALNALFHHAQFIINAATRYSCPVHASA